MMTLSNNAGQMEKSQKSARKRICTKLLVLAGLGTMVLAVCSLPLGCGSDSTPGAVKGKNDKTAAGSKDTKMQGATHSSLDKKGTNPIINRQIKHQPESQRIEIIPGVTEEELDARAEADRKIAESPDTEVLPGITKAQMDAKVAEHIASFDPKTVEVIPGMTQAQLEAKLAEHMNSFDPKTAEVMPGMTQAQVEAQNAKQEVSDKRELVPPAMGK